MADFLKHRLRAHELMDSDSADPATLRKSLAFIRRINALLGYTRATLGHLEHLCRHWRPGQRLTLLDIATGSADIPLAILRWADRRGLDVSIVAVDRHPVTAQAAADASADPRLRIVEADVFDLPFERASFDYVLTSMFLHHLDEAQVIAVLRIMDRLARRGLIVADLLRHRRAYLWIRLLTRFSNAMVRHDAVTSVAQAFRHDEVLALRDRAGLSYLDYHRHFGHRFVLAGEKTGDEGPGRPV